MGDITLSGHPLKLLNKNWDKRIGESGIMLSDKIERVAQSEDDIGSTDNLVDFLTDSPLGNEEGEHVDSRPHVTSREFMERMVSIREGHIAESTSFDSLVSGDEEHEDKVRNPDPQAVVNHRSAQSNVELLVATDGTGVEVRTSVVSQAGLLSSLGINRRAQNISNDKNKSLTHRTCCTLS